MSEQGDDQETAAATDPIGSARDSLSAAHAVLVERLKNLRQARAEINARIRGMVVEEEYLARSLAALTRPKRTRTPK